MSTYKEGFNKLNELQAILSATDKPLPRVASPDEVKAIQNCIDHASIAASTASDRDFAQGRLLRGAAGKISSLLTHFARPSDAKPVYLHRAPDGQVKFGSVKPKGMIAD